MDSRNPMQCWDLTFLFKALAGALLLIACALAVVLLDIEKGTPMRYALAALQAITFGYLTVITVGALRRLDELLQRIHLEAIATSFMLTAIVVAGWGFLAKAGLPEADWGTLIWPVMVAFWAGGVAVRRRHYQ